MSDFESSPGEADPVVARTLAAAKALEERLLPIVRATVAPLLRVGVRPPGDKFKIIEPPPIGQPIITYDGGSQMDWGPSTEADWDRYRAELERHKAGRQLGPRVMPEMEDTFIDMQTKVSVCGVISILQHLLGMHTSYPGHDACSAPLLAGPDMLPACVTDADLDMFLQEDMLDPRNLRAVLRDLRASFNAESALFSIVSDLIGFEYHAAH